MAVTDTNSGPRPRQAQPLSEGEATAVWMVAIAVAMLGVLGFINSFAAVAHAAKASFGAMAPTVPLGIDLAIAVFSAIDIVLARLDMRPRWVRWVPWALTAATVYLNVAGQTTWFGRIAHATLICLWVIAVSLAAHVARIRAQLAEGTRMDKIRVSRWFLAPSATARLWRRMVLWEERSYPAALQRERARLLARTGLQDTYGAIAWRWKAPRRARVLYRLGEHTPAVPAPVLAYGSYGPGPDAAPAGPVSETRTEPEPPADPPGRPDTPAPASGGPRTVPLARTEPAPVVDRDVVIAEIATDIRDAVEAGERWRPDYEALMQATGYGKSWCEKAVREARLSVLDPPPDRTPRADRTAPPSTPRTDVPDNPDSEPDGPDDPDGDPDRDRTDQRVLAAAST